MSEVENLYRDAQRLRGQRGATAHFDIMPAAGCVSRVVLVGLMNYHDFVRVYEVIIDTKTDCIGLILDLREFVNIGKIDAGPVAKDIRNAIIAAGPVKRPCDD